MGRDQFRVTALQLPIMHCKIFVYKRFCEPQIVEESGDGSKDVEEKAKFIRGREWSLELLCVKDVALVQIMMTAL